MRLSNLPLVTQLVSNRAGIQAQALNPVWITCSPSAIAQKTNSWQMSYREKTTHKIRVSFMFGGPFLMLSFDVFLLYPIVYIKVNLNLYHCACFIKDHPSFYPSIISLIPSTIFVRPFKGRTKAWEDLKSKDLVPNGGFPFPSCVTLGQSLNSLILRLFRLNRRNNANISVVARWSDEIVTREEVICKL